MTRALTIALACIALVSACRRVNVLEAPASPIAYAPEVLRPIQRKSPAEIAVEIDSSIRDIALRPDVYYKAWTFNGTVPGPFIRARVGDTLKVGVTNSDPSGMPHNVDFHAVLGPGGGADVTTVTPGQRRRSPSSSFFSRASTSTTVPRRPSRITSPTACTA